MTALDGAFACGVLCGLLIGLIGLMSLMLWVRRGNALAVRCVQSDAGHEDAAFEEEPCDHHYQKSEGAWSCVNCGVTWHKGGDEL